MKYEPIRRPKRGEDSLTSDFALIGQAIVDAFRGMSSSSRLESRWSKLRNGSCC